MPGETMRIKALQDEAKAIAQKAYDANREFTEAELSRIGELDAETEQLKQRKAKSEDMFRKLTEGPTGQPDTLGFGLGAKMAQHISGGHPAGFKALAPAGSVSVAVDAGLVNEARPEFSVQPLLTQRQLDGGDAFTYLQQTERTNNAAPVAEGATKPTSTYALQRIEGRAATVAHLSEPIARQQLADYADLQQFLAAEMTHGLVRAIDAQIVNGTGVDPELPGVLNTTGVRSQPFDTDPLTSCRSALTLLAQNGERATAFVFSPSDWQLIEGQRDANERYYYSGVPERGGTPTLWGKPVVQSLDLPQGTAIVGDWATCTLFTRSQVVLDWNESGELFEQNMVRFRCETRVGLAIGRPGALATVALAAA